MNDETRRPTLSLIVPVLNEQDSIRPFINEIQLKLAELPADLEILFIDDGSSDNTVAEIELAAEADERIRYLKLSRNFGKEAAMTAGLDYASGDAVIPIDVDLQDPPELIHDFFRLWREGYDTVYGARASRAEDGRRKRASAGLFYRLFNHISHMSIPPNVGDYRLLDKRVVEVIRKLPERNRFMKGIFAWPGFTSIAVEYSRPARRHGKTKFNYWKLWNFAVDGITSFSTWPLRIWSYIGSFIALASLLYMTYIIIRTMILGVEWPGYASMMSAILFFGAIQLISIGILGEYVGRLYIESKDRPIYLLDRTNIKPEKKMIE